MARQYCMIRAKDKQTKNPIKKQASEQQTHRKLPVWGWRMGLAHGTGAWGWRMGLEELAQSVTHLLYNLKN